jgi:hypothetical protein
MIIIPKEMFTVDVVELDTNSLPVNVKILRVNAITIGKINTDKREITLTSDGINFKDTQPIVRTFLRQFFYELYDHREMGVILGCIDTGHCMVLKNDISFRY